jgi:hypothetical protein
LPQQIPDWAPRTTRCRPTHRPQRNPPGDTRSHSTGKCTVGRPLKDVKPAAKVIHGPPIPAAVIHSFRRLRIPVLARWQRCYQRLGQGRGIPIASSSPFCHSHPPVCAELYISSNGFISSIIQSLGTLPNASLSHRQQRLFARWADDERLETLSKSASRPYSRPARFRGDQMPTRECLDMS